MYRDQKILLFIVVVLFALVAGRTPGQRQGSCSGVRGLVPAAQGEPSCAAVAEPMHDRGAVPSAVEEGKRREKGR